MFELKVKTHFAAAHQLTMVGEKCENLHGHNWRVEAYITGENLNAAGVLMDFGIVKRYVRGIMKTLDHKFLNDDPVFKGNPSSERIAQYIAERLQRDIDGDPGTGKGIRVSRVSAWESDNACATYIP